MRDVQLTVPPSPKQARQICKRDSLGSVLVFGSFKCASLFAGKLRRNPLRHFRGGPSLRPKRHAPSAPSAFPVEGCRVAPQLVQRHRLRAGHQALAPRGAPGEASDQHGCAPVTPPHPQTRKDGGRRTQEQQGRPVLRGAGEPPAMCHKNE